MRARLRGLFDGAGWSVGLAAALFVFALLVVLLEVQSPEIVLWTGHRVVGSEQGGIVFYRWHGQNYSLDAPGFGSAKAVGVYLDPGNPADAMINDVGDRAFGILLVGVPVAGGVALLTIGLTRRYRWARRRRRRGNAAAGHLLDSDFVARQLRELRREGDNVP